MLLIFLALLILSCGREKVVGVPKGGENESQNLSLTFEGELFKVAKLFRFPLYFIPVGILGKGECSIKGKVVYEDCFVLSLRAVLRGSCSFFGNSLNCSDLSLISGGEQYLLSFKRSFNRGVITFSFFIRDSGGNSLEGRELKVDFNNESYQLVSTPILYDGLPYSLEFYSLHFNGYSFDSGTLRISSTYSYLEYDFANNLCLYFDGNSLKGCSLSF